MLKTKTPYLLRSKSNILKYMKLMVQIFYFSNQFQVRFKITRNQRTQKPVILILAYTTLKNGGLKVHDFFEWNFMKYSPKYDIDENLVLIKHLNFCTLVTRYLSSKKRKKIFKNQKKLSFI